MTERDSEIARDALVFELDLEAPPSRVWRALATPELREAWLGRPKDGEVRVVGSAPGERLDLAWPTPEGESLIRFAIEPAGDGARLTITHEAPRSAVVVALAPRAARRSSAEPLLARAWRMAA